MNWLNKLERRLGHFAIPGVYRYIVILQIAFFVIAWVFGEKFTNGMALDPIAIMHGEVWRLVTYIFIPPVSARGWELFMIFYFMFQFYLGDVLEAEWDTFKLNLFLLVGMILHTAAALFMMWIMGSYSNDFAISNKYFVLSVFFSYATLRPNQSLLLFFILPVKVKWLALLSAVFVVFELITAPVLYKLVILACLGNYLIFFGRHWTQEFRQRASSQTKRSGPIAALIPSQHFHKCSECGKTDQTDPELEFRFSSKDEQEYCTKHLPSSNTQGT